MKAPVSSCCVIHVQYIGKQNRSKIGKKNVICYCLHFECCYGCLLLFSCGVSLEVAGVREGCPTQFLLTALS